jgi:hypothetical protein
LDYRNPKGLHKIKEVKEEPSERRRTALPSNAQRHFTCSLKLQGCFEGQPLHFQFYQATAFIRVSTF